MNELALASLARNPRADCWLAFDAASRTVTVRTGKVELGQGIVTALAQIAGDALGLPVEQLRMVAGDTSNGPDEGWTSGSVSIQQSGGAIGIVCRLARQALDECRAEPHSREADYWSCVPLLLERTTALLREGLTKPDGLPAPQTGALVGQPTQRLDWSERLRGGCFIQDLDFPQLLHARVLRPAHPLARAKTCDAAGLSRIPGVQHVVADGSFIAIAGDDEGAVVRTLPAAHRHVQWSQPPLPTFQEALGEHDENCTAPPGGASVTVERGFLTSASIGTSTGIAIWHAEGQPTLEVWSHSQGVFALRQQLAEAHGIEEHAVVVRHAAHAGCYGHNGADDAAFEASLVARRIAGRFVRVVWTREDELVWSPMGPAMRVSIQASLDNDGTVADWRATIHSGTHANRPGWADGVRFVSAAMLSEPLPAGELKDIPAEMGWGGQRNAWPYYFPDRCSIDYRLVPMTVRTSSLRSLGAHVNVTAIESMMDELASLANIDPLEFRLRHLNDDRARTVLRRVGEMAKWSRRQESDAAFGIAFARYKNKAAYMAVVVALDLSEEVRVRHVWAAVDAGLVVNTDGARNQIEGGIVQALSWTLQEEVQWHSGGFDTIDWETYPILRFDQAPRIELDLLGDLTTEPLGVGEVACGPTAAAVANALKAGLGVRLTRMPFTRERIFSALV